MNAPAKDNVFLERLNKILFDRACFFSSEWKYDYMSNAIQLILHSRCGAVCCYVSNNFNDPTDLPSVVAECLLNSQKITATLEDTLLGSFWKSALYERITEQIVLPTQLTLNPDWNYSSWTIGDEQGGDLSLSPIIISYLDSSDFEETGNVTVYGEIPALDEINFDVKLSPDLQTSVERVYYAIKEVLEFPAEFDQKHSVLLPDFLKHNTMSSILKQHLLTGLNNPSGNSIEIEEGETEK